MPEQAERAAAVALLRSIAASADPHLHQRMDDIGDERQEALYLLSGMGEEGKAALQALHRSGEMRSPRARAALERIARGGFQVRDIVSERADERARANQKP